MREEDSKGKLYDNNIWMERNKFAIAVQAVATICERRLFI